jgi:hypothetical protein
MKDVISRKENTSRRAEATPESVAPSQLKAAPPFQLFAGTEKPTQLKGPGKETMASVADPEEEEMLGRNRS